jgi:hypothetical protein
MKRTVIIYGLIAGAVVSAFMATTMIIGATTGKSPTGIASMVLGYLGMLISFALIFVAIKSFRDKQNNGFISFGKALSMGLLISLIASTLYVLTWAIVYKYFVPDYMDKYCAAMIEEARKSASGAALQKKIDEMNEIKKVYATPWGFILYTYAEILPVGILVSLIAALVLKRKPKIAFSLTSQNVLSK